MKNYTADSPQILYIGMWENGICGKDFGRVMLLFRGDSIEIEASGDLLCSLDGSADTNERTFSCPHGVHSLFLTAMKGAVISAVKTEELLEFRMQNG